MLHHHPNNTGASPSDLLGANWLEAEFLIVVNPDGRLHRYARLGGAMIELEPMHSPEMITPVDPLETLAMDMILLAQRLRELGNPPELVMRQEEAAPRASDYLGQPMLDFSPDPEINLDFARRWDTTDFNVLIPFIADGIKDSAESAQSHGLYHAGRMLLHWLDGSGEPVTLDVDDMIHDLPGFQLHIVDTIGFGLGQNPPPTSNPKDRLNESIAYQSERYTVSVYDRKWTQVGKGVDPHDDIYGSHSELRYNYNMIADLRAGKVPEGVPKEVFDWYLAVNKVFYSLRVATVVDNVTGDVEVALIVNVRDHYAWYQNDKTGITDRLMSRVEHGGHGKNFPIHGQSSVITGRFNLKDKTTVDDKPYYQLLDTNLPVYE